MFFIVGICYSSVGSCTKYGFWKKKWKKFICYNQEFVITKFDCIYENFQQHIHGGDQPFTRGGPVRAHVEQGDVDRPQLLHNLLLELRRIRHRLSHPPAPHPSLFKLSGCIRQGKVGRG